MDIIYKCQGDSFWRGIYCNYGLFKSGLKGKKGFYSDVFEAREIAADLRFRFSHFFGEELLLAAEFFVEEIVDAVLEV